MSVVQQHPAAAEYTFSCNSVKELLSSLRDGDLVQQAQAAFETLVERYHVPLHRCIARYFGDYDQRCDVLQQVLIQLYLSLPD